MPLYAYKATSREGNSQSGYRFAASPEAVYKSLKEEGLLLTGCQESPRRPSLSRISSKSLSSRSPSVPRPLLIDFCCHMTQLDEAGVPLDSALQDLALSASHRGFRALLYSLRDSLHVGIPLSEALGHHPKVFDPVFQKLIHTAEQAGSFAPQFRHLEQHLRWQETLARQLRRSLRSPLILLGLMVALVLVMAGTVIPNLTSLLESLGLKQLPLSTRLLLYTAHSLSYVPLALLTGACVIILGYLFPKLQEALARFILKAPLYKTLALTQFWHVFAVMVSAGIDLVPSFTQAAQVIQNPYLRGQLAALAPKIAAGTSLSQAFQEVGGQTPLATALMIRFLTLSEQTGRLRELIPQAAAHHQSLAFRQVDSLVSWLEPALILIMGGFMLWIVLAIIVPFYGVLGDLS